MPLVASLRAVPLLRACHPNRKAAMVSEQPPASPGSVADAVAVSLYDTSAAAMYQLQAARELLGVPAQQMTIEDYREATTAAVRRAAEQMRRACWPAEQITDLLTGASARVVLFRADQIRDENPVAPQWWPYSTDEWSHRFAEGWKQALSQRWDHEKARLEAALMSAEPPRELWTPADWAEHAVSVCVAVDLSRRDHPVLAGTTDTTAVPESLENEWPLMLEALLAGFGDDRWPAALRRSEPAAATDPPRLIGHSDPSTRAEQLRSSARSAVMSFLRGCRAERRLRVAVRAETLDIEPVVAVSPPGLAEEFLAAARHGWVWTRTALTMMDDRAAESRTVAAGGGWGASIEAAAYEAALAWNDDNGKPVAVDAEYWPMMQKMLADISTDALTEMRARL